MRSPRSPSIARIGVVLGLAGALALLFVQLARERTQRSAPVACTGSACLPDVSYTDVAGESYTAEALRGKIVLVNFWATWCSPCQREIPALSRAYDKYRARGVVFLGVVTDGIDSQALLNFQSDHEMSYPIVRSSSELMVSYNYPSSLPTTFVFDRSGRQVFTRTGALRTSDLDALLDRLTAPGA